MCEMDRATSKLPMACSSLHGKASSAFHEVVSIFLEHSATHGSPWDPIRPQVHTWDTMGTHGISQWEDEAKNSATHVTPGPRNLCGDRWRWLLEVSVGFHWDQVGPTTNSNLD